MVKWISCICWCRCPWLFVFVIAAVFWWNLKSGQFEDLEGPGYRILMDDDRPEVQEKHAIG
jgi:cbb3-type cytochrome oxidase maturation protein